MITVNTPAKRRGENWGKRFVFVNMYCFASWGRLGGREGFGPSVLSSAKMSP